MVYFIFRLQIERHWPLFASVPSSIGRRSIASSSPSPFAVGAPKALSFCRFWNGDSAPFGSISVGPTCLQPNVRPFVLPIRVSPRIDAGGLASDRSIRAFLPEMSWAPSTSRVSNAPNHHFPRPFPILCVAPYKPPGVHDPPRYFVEFHSPPLPGPRATTPRAGAAPLTTPANRS